MTVSLIVAKSTNNVIGKDNALPWSIPADLKYFKEVTLGKTVIMGRKTLESIGRALPGRTNVVLSRTGDVNIEGVIVRNSLEEAISAYGSDGEVIIIGGSQIYAQAIDLVDRMYITHVDACVEGDAYFPEVDLSLFDRTSEVSNDVSPDNIYPYRFTVFDRKEK